MWRALESTQSSVQKTQETNLAAMEQIMDAANAAASATAALAAQVQSMQQPGVVARMQTPIHDGLTTSIPERAAAAATLAETSAATPALSTTLVDLNAASAPVKEVVIRPEVAKHLKQCGKRFGEILAKWRKAQNRVRQDQEDH